MASAQSIQKEKQQRIKQKQREAVLVKFTSDEELMRFRRGAI